jgi:hypothetical protein
LHPAALGIAALAAGLSLAPAVAQDKKADSNVTADEVKKQKRELLRRMEELEAKLPSGLARKVMILSMRIASGYCSPYAVRDFEDELAAVDPAAAKLFEAEWKRVKEHPLWPSTAELRKPAPPKPES